MKRSPLGKLKTIFSTAYLNYLGFKSNRKFCVIESDDWGSVRMPNLITYETLLENRIRVDKCPYNRLDNLESTEDILRLRDTLNKLEKKIRKRVVITANVVMSNPDFLKIEESTFQKFSELNLRQSHDYYNGNTEGLEMFKQVVEEGYLYPQLHGLNHVNQNNWLSDLKCKVQDTTIAFNNNVYGLSTNIAAKPRKTYLAALDFVEEDELQRHRSWMKDGAELFKEEFGFTSRSFIAPNYTWHQAHESMMLANGIRYIQGARAQKVPLGDNYRVDRHCMGEQNKYGQFYLVRNSAFEPSVKGQVNWKKKILSDAYIAFAFGAPLVISSHRLNFMGGIQRQNRERNLQNFSAILTGLIERYPDIEFVSSEKLGDYISSQA
ncbi:MAG: hypothetical protein ACRBG0_04405 [Lewinella sp.]|uniref:hypothetical protein n=1 Tax=Lewinella sp. TaxID=2004506 RepID=UPI003D6AC8DA